MRAKAEPSEGSSGAGGSTYKMGPSRGCWLARGPDSAWLLTGGLSSSPGDPCNSTAEMSSQHDSWFPNVSDPRGRDQAGGHWAFHGLVSEATHHPF